MKNNYEVRGNVAAIFINGQGRVHETMISMEDLAKAQTFPGTWYAQKEKANDDFYVRGQPPRVNGKQHPIFFHRFLTDAPKGLVVDHINHDTLNNTRENLRVVTVSVNNSNKKKEAQRNNKSSGVKGVHWLPSNKSWSAKFSYLGVNHFIGCYKTVEKAKKAIEDARRRICA